MEESCDVTSRNLVAGVDERGSSCCSPASESFPVCSFSSSMICSVEREGVNLSGTGGGWELGLESIDCTLGISLSPRSCEGVWLRLSDGAWSGEGTQS